MFRNGLALPFDSIVPGVTKADPTLSTMIERLHKARAALPNHSPEMSALDGVLIPLLLFARQNDPSYGPLDTPRNIVTSDVTDFLLLDITPESYVSIGIDLGVGRWAVAAPATQVVFPVEGIVWGLNKRVLIPLLCRKGARPPIVLHMLLDTGSPGTLLCSDTFAKLGYTESTPTDATVELHGCPTFVTLSHSHFTHNDVLGADWLHSVRARVTIDYTSFRVKLDGSAPLLATTTSASPSGECPAVTE